MLRNIALFEALSDQDLELLAGPLGKRTFGRGVTIFHKGSPGETMYIIESGKVRIFMLSESGQEMSVRVCGRGRHRQPVARSRGQVLCSQEPNAQDLLPLERARLFPVGADGRHTR